MTNPKTQLDVADQILIKLVDKALKAGVGRSFRWRKSTTPGNPDIMVKVLDITDKEVRIKVGHEEMTLPKDVRRIANQTAMLMGRIKHG